MCKSSPVFSSRKNVAFIFIFIISVFSYFSILRSPLFFVDDAARISTNASVNQGVHGRPFADIVYMFLSGGVFVDISPFSQILSICCMIFGIIFLTKNFKFIPDNAWTEESDVNFFSIFHLHSTSFEYLLLILVFVCFPLNFSVISYRFDSITMSFSLLCSCLSFAICQYAYMRKKQKKLLYTYLLSSSLLICFSLGSYQPMVGFYTTFGCLVVSNMILSDNKWRDIFKKSFFFMLPLIIGSVFYLPIYLHAKYMASQAFYSLKKHPYIVEHNSLLPVGEIFTSSLSNALNFVKYYVSYLGVNALSFFVIAIMCVLIVEIILKNVGFFRKILTIVGVFFALISCASIQVFLKSPIFVVRTSVALSAFVSGVLLIILVHNKYIFIRKMVICLMILLLLTSVGLLSAIGNAQRDQYYYENDIVYNGLESDISQLYYKSNLKSFSVTPLPQDCCVNTLSILQKKYHFLHEFGTMTSSMFSVLKMLSYLPIEYVLSANFGKKYDTDSFEIIIDKLNYTIRKVSDTEYIVVLHPPAVIPFTPQRYR